MVTGKNREGEYRPPRFLSAFPLVSTKLTAFPPPLLSEYVDRLVQFLLVDSVSRQFKAFQRGWLSVCEGKRSKRVLVASNER